MILCLVVPQQRDSKTVYEIFFTVGNKDNDTTSIDDDLLYVFLALNNFYTSVQNFYWLPRTSSYLLITQWSNLGS